MTTTSGSIPPAARSMISLQDDGFFDSMRRTTRPSIERGRQRPSTSSTRRDGGQRCRRIDAERGGPGQCEERIRCRGPARQPQVEGEVEVGPPDATLGHAPGGRRAGEAAGRAGPVVAVPTQPDAAGPADLAVHVPPQSARHPDDVAIVADGPGHEGVIGVGDDRARPGDGGERRLPVAGERLAPHPALQVVAAQVHEEDRPWSRRLRDRAEVALVRLEDGERGAAVRVQRRDEALRHVGPGRVVGDGAGRPQGLREQPARRALAVRRRDEGNLAARGEPAQGIGVDPEGDATAHRGPPAAAEAARRRGGRPPGGERDPRPAERGGRATMSCAGILA